VDDRLYLQSLNRGSLKGENELTDNDLKEICVKSAQIVGCEITGIDIMIPENEVEEDYYIIEVNSCPAWEGLQKTTHLNIAEAIIEYLVTKIRQ
jgi:glutathione synthase/RimK-type ligase-like ATP-grasp enzyme